MTAPASLSAGAIFATDYRIVKPLSAGGMGAVYVAEQLSTAKLRALKLMHPQLVANPDLRRRFEQEARIGARIESEHVVEVQAAGVDAASGVPYLVMELLEGEDLASTVQKRGRLPPAEVRTIFEQLCHAMAAAHSAGIVHRDLKPENLFLARSKRAGSDFTVKVLDFGIAKLVAEGHGKSTAAVGSPLWLAPEQTERKPVDPAADVWALGLIAFYLLAGFGFWKVSDDEHATVTQVLREIIFDPIPHASERAAQRGITLPGGFDAWFARCVSRPVETRFADAGAAFAALAPILAGGTVSASTPNAAAASSLATAATLLPSEGIAPAPSTAPPPNAGYPGTPPPVYHNGTTPAPRRSSAWIVYAVGGAIVVCAAFAGLAYLVTPKTNESTAAMGSTSALAPPASTVPPVTIAPTRYLFITARTNHSGKTDFLLDEMFIRVLRDELRALGIETSAPSTTVDDARRVATTGKLGIYDVAIAVSVTNDAEGRHIVSDADLSGFAGGAYLARTTSSVTAKGATESEDPDLFAALAKTFASRILNGLESVAADSPSATTTAAASAPKPKPSASASTAKAPPVLPLYDQAAMKFKSGDYDGARKLLQPRVWSGKSSPSDRDLLRMACEQLKDAACLARLDAMESGN